LQLDDSAALHAFAERLTAWQTKALREAKQRSTWFDPDSDYEAACARFVERLFDPAQGGDALAGILAFVESIAPAGAVNSLAQTVLKLTVPGVPDIYQGTDWWDLSLMDPDNRRPVDFTARRVAESVPAEAAELWAEWPNGRIKHNAITRILGLRRRRPALFASGDYVPLELIGAARDHAIAFARVDAESSLVVIVPLHSARRLDNAGVAPIIDWGDTSVILPEGLAGHRFESVMGPGSVAPLNGRLPVADVMFTCDALNRGFAIQGSGALARHQRFSAAQASTPQPARKPSPPIGVTAPRTRTPLNASTYRLPLNSTMPASISQPATFSIGAKPLRSNRPISTNPSAWTIW
jgi:(1->4)-alpha-D-glucan 1-alpha-D-glucosylmutase